MKHLLLPLLLLGISFSSFGQDKRIIQPRTVPAVPYPFSPGVISNGFLFVSGQVGTDPQSGKLIDGGIEAETAQTIQNITTVLKDAGTSLENVVSVTVYLSNMDDFPKMNAIYQKYFQKDNYPARTTVGVAKLVFGASVEMTMTAAVPPRRMK
ncbi:RidA family protein [Spirosoma validum]|uniref:RidA family protein n=1 Tax=Spirosoma validum TaxID=2771355 RepID=A0A927GES8_9BACT|nr:RidA family protein [Spirosoma validum]MBD2754961.1 RidA family protein [Spirosoma validum]